MHPDHWAHIAAVAAGQRGLVSRHQALLSGCSIRALERAVERGLLVAVRREVLAVAGAPSSVWRPLMAAYLATSPGIFASHRAAAGLHGFPGILRGAVELTVPSRRPVRLEGARCHTTTVVIAGDVTEACGLRVSSASRTIVDLAGQLSPHLLRRIVELACRRRLCTLDELSVRLEQLGGRGRPGTVRLRRVLDDQVGGDSDLEARWLRTLAAADLEPPALQHQVVAAGRVLILDLAWPEQRVGVEVDGWEPHRDRSVWDHDHDKANAYLEAGWRVLFVTSNSRPREVVRQLRLFMSRQAASSWRAIAN